MTNPFWEFSLAFYGRPGVAPACLRLQDEGGADVNIALFLLWRARSGVRLCEQDLACADALVAGWRERIVEPLRAMRRRLKTDPMLDGDGAFRAGVKAVELEAERLEQDALFRAAPDLGGTPGSPPGEAARKGLLAYEATLGRPLPGEAVQAILTAFEAELTDAPAPAGSPSDGTSA